MTRLSDEVTHTVIIETKKHKTVIAIPTKGTDSPLTTNQEIILELSDDIEKLLGEIAQLTAKHDRLVNGLKEIQTETVFDLIGDRQQAVTYQTLMFLITEEGNV